MKSIIGKVIFVFTVAMFIFAGCKNEVEKLVEVEKEVEVEKNLIIPHQNRLKT